MTWLGPGFVAYWAPAPEELGNIVCEMGKIDFYVDNDSINN